MILKNCGYAEFVKRVATKGCIVVGASTILDRFVEYSPDITDKIISIVDNFKHGEEYQLKNKHFMVYPVDTLQTMNMQDKIILICSNHRYAELIEQLNGIANLQNTECYISVFISSIIENNDDKEVMKSIENDKKSIPQIPKIIHCFWFSKEPKPKLQQRCLDSWKKFCPEYRIMEWNTDNYDIHKNVYMEQAFEKRKWAFASDYARLDVLQQYGGVYLDLDVEIVKNFDSLLYQKAFFSFSCGNIIDLGAGMGSVKNHPIIKELLKVYDNMEFLDKNGNMDITPQPQILLPVFEKFGVKMNGHMQRVEDTVFYPSDYFSPVDLLFFDIQQTDNTYSIHHFAASWYNKEHAENRNTKVALAQKILKVMKENDKKEKGEICSEGNSSVSKDVLR